MIEWVESNDQAIWARREGRALCSTRDPLSEAKKWVHSLHLKGSEREIAVVGVGATYHLLELRKTFPSLRILVFQTEEINLASAPQALRNSWDEFMQSNVVLYQGDEAHDRALSAVVQGPVFCFRPAATPGDLFVFDHLLGQDPNWFRRLCDILDLSDLKTSADRIPDSLAVNIKTIKFEPRAHASEEEKLYHVLKELVR